MLFWDACRVLGLSSTPCFNASRCQPSRPNAKKRKLTSGELNLAQSHGKQTLQVVSKLSKQLGHPEQERFDEEIITSIMSRGMDMRSMLSLIVKLKKWRSRSRNSNGAKSLDRLPVPVHREHA